MTIFLDTGIFFSTYNLDDVLNRDGAAIYVSAFSGKWGAVYTSDYIIDETCTLLKIRAGSEFSVKFLKTLRESVRISILRVDERIFEKTCEIFEKYHEKAGLSFTDASTIALLREADIEFLASFDSRSFEGIVEWRIGENFWSSLTEEEKERIKKEIPSPG